MRRLRALLALALWPVVSAGQGTRPDTSAPPTLGAVVIVAERTATPINQSAAAITRLSATDLRRLPFATVADVLRRVPGFAVVDFDGLGRDPQLVTRGFYGGGEAEYVVVLLDGRPVNLAHNGTVAWEALPPLSAIESIEMVRGSASTMHGDAAVAGVINIVTRSRARAEARWRASAESHSGLSASVDLTHPMDGRDASASFGFDRTSGFRDHAERTSATARGSMRLARQLRGILRAAWRDYDEPGPLLESLLGDGSESDPRFQQDGGRDREGEIAVHHDGVLGAGGSLSTTVRFGARRMDLVRTLPLSPDFGDTRERELRTTTSGVTTQADLTPTILPLGIEHVSAGGSIDFSTLNSAWFSEDRGSRVRDARGTGWRGGVAGFLNLIARPVEAVRWTLGARADYLHDSFEPDAPGGDFSGNHFALSPKLGVNVRYATEGRFWVSASRTFKTPTLDQLYDQRPIPVPFPPFSLTTSNPDLDPQRGTSVEAGLYHDVSLGSSSLGLAVTMYRIEMQDEIDFDVQTLKYINIARSRHQGTEAAITFARGMVSAHASLTLQDAVSRAGPNNGNRLKAIPGQVYSVGVTAATRAFGTTTVSLTRTADMFIDDANTQRIPSWTRVDALVAYPSGPFDIIAGARNLLDARYNSTAFLDPSGSGQAYVYPAAGRVFTIGVRHGR